MSTRVFTLEFLAQQSRRQQQRGIHPLCALPIARSHSANMGPPRSARRLRLQRRRRSREPATDHSRGACSVSHPNPHHRAVLASRPLHIHPPRPAPHSTSHAGNSNTTPTTNTRPPSPVLPPPDEHPSTPDLHFHLRPLLLSTNLNPDDIQTPHPPLSGAKTPPQKHRYAETPRGRGRLRRACGVFEY